jgi:hypothetical protein
MGGMVANQKTVDQIIKILLKHMDRKKAKCIGRDLYGHVSGSKSVTDTFRRIVEKLEEEEEKA